MEYRYTDMKYFITQECEKVLNKLNKENSCLSFAVQISL